MIELISDLGFVPLVLGALAAVLLVAVVLLVIALEDAQAERDEWRKGFRAEQDAREKLHRLYLEGVLHWTGETPTLAPISCSGDSVYNDIVYNAPASSYVTAGGDEKEAAIGNH